MNSHFELPYDRANVIWILCDQLRADALSYRGDRNVRTPNIDNLARQSVRFDRAVAGAPWCAPFRGSLLTSLYPNQNGVYRVPAPLNPTIPTITKPLKEHGYHTAWVGKWHLDGSNENTHFVPPERRGGFDYWLGYENNNNQNETYVFGTGNEKPFLLPGYETDSLTDVFLDHLNEHCKNKNEEGKVQPFFASLSVQPPHDPYVPPHDIGDKEYFKHPEEIQLNPNVPQIKKIQDRSKMDLAGYYGMIENLDKNVGRVMQAVKDMGVERNTYIVFFSDHGDCHGAHGQVQKSSPWEESIRIPFLIASLGGSYHMNLAATDAVINHVDIAPTTLGLCGIDQPDWMNGYDYSSQCIKPTRPEYKTNLKQSPEPESAYLQQVPEKKRPHTVNKAWRGVATRDGWKYVCIPGHDWLLFNTFEDPYEMDNRVYNSAYQEDKERCHKLLQEWIKSTGDEFELPESV